MAKLPYCGDLVAILNEYVATQHVASELTANENNSMAATEMDSRESSAGPSSGVLVRAFLSLGKVIEFHCQRGDDTLQVLFQALAENTAVDGTSEDRLLAIPANEGDENMNYFLLSTLVGLETIPIRTV
jgi:hypothetical protein